MSILASILEVIGIALAGTALYHLGGGWLLALAIGLAVTCAGVTLGRPAAPPEPS